MADVGKYERALGPLQVGLRKDLHVTRQETRGGPRYLIHDPITFQNHAFSPSDYRILMALTPQRSLAETFRLLVERRHLVAGDKEGFFKFVMWLHGIGVVQLPISNSDVLFSRYMRRKEARRASIFQLLLSYRIPLFHPDRLLDRSLRWFGWLFTGKGLLLWLSLMLAVLWKCLGRFGELFSETTEILAISNLPLLWGSLILLKVIHEFGHAYACKRYGGAVPEMGIVMILMTPCAYVDASASWKFPRRRQRLSVALAGMYVESMIAAIAALVWAGTQPGLVHSAAVNVVTLASIVTVLFNLNPLMKFDGYYVFSDLLGVFNLQQRAQEFFKSWVGHLALGWPRPKKRFSPREAWLYASYGPAAFVYRIFLAFAITSLVVMQWPAAGLVVGVVFAWSLMVRPVWRLVVYLWSSEETESVRTRARLVAIGGTVIAPMLLGFLPISHSVTAPGILDPGVRESVRAPTSGFVTNVVAADGSVVDAG